MNTIRDKEVSAKKAKKAPVMKPVNGGHIMVINQGKEGDFTLGKWGGEIRIFMSMDAAAKKASSMGFEELTISGMQPNQ